VIKFVGDLRQVGAWFSPGILVFSGYPGFLPVSWFPPLIQLTYRTFGIGTLKATCYSNTAVLFSVAKAPIV
jgi:hypothetical protein